MSATPMRRVVTGHDTKGQAIIVENGPPPTIVPLKAVPGTIFYEIWSTRGSPARIDNGADPTLGALELKPPRRGSRVRILDIPPDSAQNALSSEDAAAAFREIGGGDALDHKGNTRHRLMHRTETVDYGILISGELWLVLDEGEVRLSPGDVVVQRGTNHAWSNRSGESARIAFVLIDGEFSDEVPR